MRQFLGILCLAATLLATGCGTTFGPKARHGITFYCPGAGNVDRGDAGIREGLERRGYRGQVARLGWSVSFNPVIDQRVTAFAQIGAARLAGYIQDYLDKYPGREVNVVGLSAGTGVAMWAIESLKPGYRVNNVVLIASSLSSDYDISKALPHISGRIYNYYSPNDAVLSGPMKVFGTIDGKFLVDGAGSVGLNPPRGGDAVMNIRWRPEFERYGYYGGHLDGTSPAFVQHHIAQHIVTAQSAGLLDTEKGRRIIAALRGDSEKPDAATQHRPAEVAVDDNAQYERLLRVLDGESPPPLISGFEPLEPFDTVVATPPATALRDERWD